MHHAINELDIDLICLQEVAENWNNGDGDWNSNAARIICERLDRRYHLFADWAHLGFDHYREGVAILSNTRSPLRGALRVRIARPTQAFMRAKRWRHRWMYPISARSNIFQPIFSWWKDGFRRQFDTLGTGPAAAWRVT